MAVIEPTANKFKSVFLKKRQFIVIQIIIIFFWSLATWFYVESAKGNKQKSTSEKEVRQGGYKFISPLLECELQENDSIQKYIPFENRLKEKITTEIIDQNPDIHLSVYFRNLNNGPWFGIDEEKIFAPASLLKVPLMIAYLKEIEDDPRVAQLQFEFKEENENTVSQVVVPASKMELGKSYTVEDLLHRMIVYSDNEAASILISRMPRDKMIKTYAQLGVVDPDTQNLDDFMSVKEYASFFRLLYNSAYLNRNSSEKALELLSQTDYDRGLRAGVDNKDVVIAHKFGERQASEGGKNVRQLHDCGIIYYKEYPYLLCVMTRGDDFDKLEKVIARVSELTFDEIKKDYP